MSGDEPKTKTPPGDGTKAWKGKERRVSPPRRHESRRLDERRLAGIGEVIDDRRGGGRGKGRRGNDRRTQQGRRRSK